MAEKFQKTDEKNFKSPPDDVQELIKKFQELTINDVPYSEGFSDLGNAEQSHKTLTKLTEKPKGTEAMSCSSKETVCSKMDVTKSDESLLQMDIECGSEKSDTMEMNL